jgi:Fe-S-cluster-containing dehydrogenase component
MRTKHSLRIAQVVPRAICGLVVPCFYRIFQNQLSKISPGEALLFGDLDDPDSRISKLVNSQDTIVLLPNKETRPHVYYGVLPEGLYNSEDMVKVVES